MRIAVSFAILVGCTTPPVAIAPLPPIATTGAAPIAHDSVHCGSLPAMRAAGFRHARSKVLSHGHAEHRGDDLIAVVGEDQRITGRVAYTHVDRPIADEAVEIFACEQAAWVSLGATRTADDGQFALELAGARRLGAGLTDLYLRVPGDMTGAAFVAFVAPRGAPIVIVDVDGTLTTSEDAIVSRGLLGRAIAAQPDAAAALAHAPGQVVYVTARGEHFATATRRWLAERGFPRGPVRFAPGWFARPRRRVARREVACARGAHRSVRVCGRHRQSRERRRRVSRGRRRARAHLRQAARVRAGARAAPGRARRGRVHELRRARVLTT